MLLQVGAIFSFGVLLEQFWLMNNFKPLDCGPCPPEPPSLLFFRA